MGIKDWTGNSVAYCKTLGATSHGLQDREKVDFYATEPKAIKLLLQLEKFHPNIWECACGEGHLSEALIGEGYNVFSTDKYYRVYSSQDLDFLDFNISENTILPFNEFDIITNPPYKYVDDFISHGLNILKPNRKLVLLLPIRYLEGKKRKEIFKINPPKTIYVSSSRIKCAIAGDFDNMTGSAVCYAWFIWECGYKGETILKWFN